MIAKPPAVMLTRRYVMSLVRNAEAAAMLRTLVQREMTFGVHWVWLRGEEQFTEVALELIIEGLRDAYPAIAEAIENAISASREKRIKNKHAKERMKAKKAAALTTTGKQPRRPMWWQKY